MTLTLLVVYVSHTISFPSCEALTSSLQERNKIVLVGLSLPELSCSLYLRAARHPADQQHLSHLESVDQCMA